MECRDPNALGVFEARLFAFVRFLRRSYTSSKQCAQRFLYARRCAFWHADVYYSFTRQHVDEQIGLIAIVHQLRIEGVRLREKQMTRLIGDRRGIPSKRARHGSHFVACARYVRPAAARLRPSECGWLLVSGAFEKATRYGTGEVSSQDVTSGPSLAPRSHQCRGQSKTWERPGGKLNLCNDRLPAVTGCAAAICLNVA